MRRGAARAAKSPRYSVPIETRTVFSPLPASAGAPRRFVRDVLMIRRVGDPVVETVELLTSELVTNAVIHAHPPAEPTTCSPPPAGASPSRELAAEWDVEQVPDEGERMRFEGAEMTEGTAVRRRRVRLLPAELQVRNMRHLGRPAARAAPSCRQPSTPGRRGRGPRLAALMSETVEAYAPARDTVWQHAEVARAEGREVVDLDVALPAEPAGAAARLFELLRRPTGCARRCRCSPWRHRPR